MYPPSSLIATGILFPLLGMVAVGLRFVVRLRSKAFLGGDDWTILAAWFIVCGMAACQIFGKGQAAVVALGCFLPSLLTRIPPAGAVSGQIGTEGQPGVPNKVSVP